MSERCDNQYNCQDLSDEADCKTIYSDGKKNIPPDKQDGTIPLTTRVNINEFNKIDSFDTTLTLTMDIIISWIDNRIKVLNPLKQQEEILGLKKNNNFNFQL